MKIMNQMILRSDVNKTTGSKPKPVYIAFRDQGDHQDANVNFQEFIVVKIFLSPESSLHNTHSLGNSPRVSKKPDYQTILMHYFSYNINRHSCVSWPCKREKC